MSITKLFRCYRLLHLVVNPEGGVVEVEVQEKSWGLWTVNLMKIIELFMKDKLGKLLNCNKESPEMLDDPLNVSGKCPTALTGYSASVSSVGGSRALSSHLYDGLKVKLDFALFYFSFLFF